ncbi:MAG: uracil-DNA glycosylase family protein [Actinomycetota bacterium]|nr:uracil-DNA glycosylase family protein [Actinomycetota bacterium]
MDRTTVEAYDTHAERWAAARPVGPAEAGDARDFAASAERPIVDLGCGSGRHLGDLGPGVVGLDASAAMLALAAAERRGVPLVRGDLLALPFTTGAVGGAWAKQSYVHVARTAMPAALAEAHRVLRVGARLRLVVFSGDRELEPHPDDDLPGGRRFSAWEPDHLRDVVVGAGFEIDELVGEAHRLLVTAVRARTLADHVGPAMRLLICGLNPSVYAADAGVGFARPGNRFWPAAIRAGLVHTDRDPVRALADDGIGMTDLVKRATPRAAELSRAEYEDGLRRVERLVAWLRPAAVCMVGLAGWRAAADRSAVAGWQERGLGGRPLYLMPSTSGLNAHSSLDALTAHLLEAARGSSIDGAASARRPQ